jgi:hypothetical protein
MKLAAGASRPASPRIEVSMLRNKHKPAPHSSHGNLNERIQMEFDVSNVNVEISKVDFFGRMAATATNLGLATQIVEIGWDRGSAAAVG